MTATGKRKPPMSATVEVDGITYGVIEEFTPDQAARFEEANARFFAAIDQLRTPRQVTADDDSDEAFEASAVARAEPMVRARRNVTRMLRYAGVGPEIEELAADEERFDSQIKVAAALLRHVRGIVEEAVEETTDVPLPLPSFDVS